VDTVSFLSVETGKDLILAFAVMDPEDPTEIDSLILQRTPVYESLLEPHERGVKASFARFDADEEDLLKAVDWNDSTKIIRLQTKLHTYELDLRKVDRSEVKSMRKVLKKMNYDESLRLSGV
jgi:hypothetical protein